MLTTGATSAAWNIGTRMVEAFTALSQSAVSARNGSVRTARYRPPARIGWSACVTIMESRSMCPSGPVELSAQEVPRDHGLVTSCSRRTRRAQRVNFWRRRKRDAQKVCGASVGKKFNEANGLRPPAPSPDQDTCHRQDVENARTEESAVPVVCAGRF
jgi:hypothetical protein